MIEVSSAEFDMVVRCRRIIEVCLETDIVYAGAIIGVIYIGFVMVGFRFFVFILAGDLSFVTVCHRHLVMVVSYGRIAEQFVVEYIVPTSGSDRIAPVEIDIAVLEIHARTAVISVVFLVLLVIVVVFSFVETQE